MTQRLNIRIKSVVAMLLFLSSLSLCTPVSRAEIRLQTLTGMQFSLAFRPCGDALTPPFRSLLPPDAEEVSISSLYTVESSLQRHRASLALLAPRSVTLPVPIGDIIARNTDHDTQPIPLGSAAWNFPKACIELVSDEHAAPQQLVNRSLVLSASYAATAFGGTCTVWDLTSSLGRGNKVHGTPRFRPPRSLRTATRHSRPQHPGCTGRISSPPLSMIPGHHSPNRPSLRRWVMRSGPG
jgi:hypothetical protein